ncbi:response regulator transcription factor [Gorillibacterium sp. sgz5001074]|uniref:response regulator transcription factor n=1 Tax=Gorillibacterium sp. sgz5001074 TaxID=3446695 RepID=UPI003F67C38B
MWKVLIADDEPWIRSGIRSSVDWRVYGMEVAAEAEDGEEALELAVRHEVRVILVDLNMPIMNGLTLIKHIREQLPGTRIIIITGHNEFGYAQEALRMQVDDYILKPVDPAQLRTVLSRVAGELDASEKREEQLELASKQIAKNLPLLRERFCTDWIQGMLTESEILEQLGFLKLPERPPVQMGVIRWPEIRGDQRIMKENDRQLFLFAVENMAEELLREYPKVLFRDRADLIVACLWEEAPDSVFHDLEQAVQTYLKIPVQVYAERVDHPLAEIGDAYRQCKANVFKETAVSPLVRKARQTIREQFHDPDLTLESCARLLAVSPVYLSRVVKQELGTTFVGLVTGTRIKKAIQLLTSTDLSILEIAERVGYESQHYFSTAFKKVMGMSPNQYRKGSAPGSGE